MPFRVLALDLDGTTLDSKRRIRPATKAAVKEAQKKGLQVVLVTGRHHVATRPYHHELQLSTPAICCNGSYLYEYDRAQALMGTPLLKEQAKELLVFCREFGVHTLVYSERAMNFEVENEHIAGLVAWAKSCHPDIRPAIDKVDSFDRLIDESKIIWKFVLSDSDIPRLRACADAMRACLDLSYEWSWFDHVDVAQAGNSKGQLLADWVAAQGIDMTDVVAIGDNHNDISMLRMAGLGIAMGNAEDPVKAAADQVAGSNDTDAIAEAIHRFVL